MSLLFQRGKYWNAAKAKPWIEITCTYLSMCLYILFQISVSKSWLVRLIIKHKFLLVFGSSRPKWAKEEASIPRHASETPGSLQTLCGSFTSPQLDCLYISDGQRCSAAIDPSSEVLPLPLHVMRSEHKGRGQPAPACSTHLFQLPACVCVSERDEGVHTHAQAFIIIKP